MSNLCHAAIVISLKAPGISEIEQELLRHPHVGGLILFKENQDQSLPAADRKKALEVLIRDIKEIRPDLCIMVDHEGETVWRFREGFTVLPTARTYGELYAENPEQACATLKSHAKTMAEELLAAGIDRTLAPVCDTDGQSSIIGQYDRAFSHDPLVIVALATAFIEGLHEAGMPVTLKHWPGHGSVLADSHLALPQDHRSLDEIQNSDLRPFNSLIQEGVLNHPEDAVMLAHISYSEIDGGVIPAYSAQWIDILRDSGFTGPIMTDCLSMKAAYQKQDQPMLEHLSAAIPASLAAGCDWVLSTHVDPQILLSVLNSLPEPSPGFIL